jgi:hypothetical protein
VSTVVSATALAVTLAATVAFLAAIPAGSAMRRAHK